MLFPRWCTSREKPFHFCVSGLWQDGALSLGGGDVDPPGPVRDWPQVCRPTSRPEGWSSLWRTREGARGLLWMRVVAEVTYSHPRGRGPREPLLLSGSSHPQFPSLSPAATRRHVVAVVQPGSPLGPRAGRRVDLEGKWKFPALESFPYYTIISI